MYFNIFRSSKEHNMKSTKAQLWEVRYALGRSLTLQKAHEEAGDRHGDDGLGAEMG